MDFSIEGDRLRKCFMNAAAAKSTREVSCVVPRLPTLSTVNSAFKVYGIKETNTYWN